jgi:hypothetical protein
MAKIQVLRLLKREVNIALIKQLIADYEDFKDIPNINIYNVLDNKYQLSFKNEEDEYHDHIGI